MIAQLRLTPRLAKQAGIRALSDADARKALGFGIALTGNAPNYGGIAFDGYDLHGEPRGVYQVRRAYPDVVNGKVKNKWTSVKGSANRYLNTTPGALRPSATIIRVESPKSVWAITASAARVGRKNIKVVDTHGLDGYLVRDSEDQPSYPNPDLMLFGDHDVISATDSNVQGRPDLLAKEQRFEAYLLDKVGVKSLRTMRIPPEDGINGPDDFILAKGDAAFWALVDGARPAWMEAFPPASDFRDLELKADLLIPHIIANGAVTILAAVSEGYKTVFAMQVCRSLLLGEAAFEYFPVEKTVRGVVYCCPDMSFELVLKYVRPMGLDRLTKHFHIRTMKQGELLGPDHPYVIAAARAGCYLVLDTLNYFIEEDNNPQVLNRFTTKLRHLVDECGGPGAMVLAHPTKTGARSTETDVTEWVSGTYAKIGTVDNIFILRNIPLTNLKVTGSVHVSREKGRSFLGVELRPFTLSVLDGEGSLLERGRFPIASKPGTVRNDVFPKRSKGGKPPDAEKEPKKKWIEAHLQDQAGKRAPSGAELARRLNSAFHSTHDAGTIRDWLKEINLEKKLIAKIQEEK
jgi:hypothetical protein